MRFSDCDKYFFSGIIKQLVKLTRRDAILALTGSGVAVGGKHVADRWTQSTGPETELTQTDVDTLVALTEVLYPSQVDVTKDFVETYVTVQFKRGNDIEAVSKALQYLRNTARRKTGHAYDALSRTTKDDVLRSTGADRAHPDPDGTMPEQLRYFLINGLLYALYSTPKGAELVGNPNPEGYPGGIEAYQRGPESE